MRVLVVMALVMSSSGCVAMMNRSDERRRLAFMAATTHIHNGMTAAEVTAVLGPPSEVRGESCPEPYTSITCQRWLYVSEVGYSRRFLDLSFVPRADDAILAYWAWR